MRQRPASAKLQCRKSRKVKALWCSGLYGDLASLDGAMAGAGCGQLQIIEDKTGDLGDPMHGRVVRSSVLHA
jgi:hypothetical protein